MKWKLNREIKTTYHTSEQQPVTALDSITTGRQETQQQHRKKLHATNTKDLIVMQQAYKPRTSDATAHRSNAGRTNNYAVETSSPATPARTSSITPTPSQTPTDIYIIGGHGSNPATMERKQHHRLSWVNMRRNGEAAAVAGTIVMPSPQTSRSYVSNTSVVAGGRGGEGVGSASGRTTSASGHVSTSGVHTISGSNNTLNDIISDYHSQEVGSNDYHYTASTSSPAKNLSSNGSFHVGNGSTVKLLPTVDDESNKQTKCSVFRGLMLCICLNVTYANIVRFPRELDKYGSAYLIPYVTLLFLVGLPIILLEISVGQFLGQGAAHTWRASPIFKGASIVSRFASWLSTIWVSLQAVLAVAYIGMFIFRTVPFSECIDDIKLAHNGYKVIGNSGQECLQKTFLTPFWENPLYFGLLSIGLICIWIVVMLCTHNGKMLRRSLFFFGFIGFVLLCTVTGWEVHNSFERTYFPELWPFESMWLLNSNIWFSALMQVLFATNCGFGALPMLTGKFLYKGDAVRTSVVYLCFNLLINAIAVTLFMVQFDVAANSGNMLEELKPMTAIYDRILYDKPSTELLAKLIPTLILTMIVISALISLMVAIYTSTRLVPRHPNYVISLIALVMTIVSLAAPNFAIARILDSRLVGTLSITALVFELIAITWIYGAKNIYTDLEFSIGRPILKSWMALWCFCPVLLTGVLVWWCADDDQYDLLAEYMPRWAPILFVLAIVLIIAGILIFRQVEYNFFGMICEAAKSAKEWGPADPLARHAWKQWRSVCQDTGRRDFTLRRRGTRDYTHSIKKGQYSASAKFANGQAVNNQNWKSSTPGNSSPNYSGSMFGDSAIEEDISVDKFPGITQQQQQQQFVPFQTHDGKPLRYSHRARTQQRVPPQQQNNMERLHAEKHREVVYIRRLSSDDGHHATRIEITPSNESITYGGGVRNPLAKQHSNGNAGSANVKRSSSSSALEPNRNSIINLVGKNGTLPPTAANGNGDHICWRKFSVNAQEYSTEL